MTRMAQKKWHVTPSDDGLILSRQRPARFDFASTVIIEGGGALRKSRMAHQVRQDMWRALQALRGYAPAVEVRVIGKDLQITAGGGVHGVFPKDKTEQAVADVLNCPVKQARWIRSSQRACKEVSDA